MKFKACILFVILIYAVNIFAQDRKVSPVENEDNKSQKPTLLFYDKHGKQLEEPVFVLTEDTVAKTKFKLLYPRLTSVSIGANFFDAIMKVAGQSYGSYDVWGSLSIHNWLFPTLEAGVGYINSTPKEGNFTYKGKPSFYVKAGLDYNFLYNSTPDYNVFIGLRAGYSSFSYDIENISISSDYWGQTNNFSLSSQKAHAFYGEVLGGIKVKIYKRLSLGWTIRYKFKFNVSDAADSSPWFIPGYGLKNRSLSATFSVIYTLPLSKQQVELNHE
jgi:hypothetical protein